MGQTLTHGVYLPAEGERNCYDGLASNWNILDGAVGTIAEHTTALAGKAGLTANNTFTGTNSFSQHQILQAGAYFYNSDPTAATSGLNLRNSKVTKGGTSDNGSQIIQFLDKDNKFLSQITTAKALSGTTQLQFTLGNIDSNNNSITGGITFSLAIDGTKQFIPGSNNTHNLGNSSYQWNNVYSKRVNTQTLNGTNPGALSLPDLTKLLNLDVIPPTGEATVNWSNGANTFTPPADGWVSIRHDNCKSIQVYQNAYNRLGVTSERSFYGKVVVSLPVRSGYLYTLYMDAQSGNVHYQFYPCEGNV